MTRSESVVRNPRRLGPMGFVREAARARGAGPDPETVFRLLRPFHGPEFDAIYDRVMADPVGRWILHEGRSLHPTLLGFDRLRALPQGSLGREYLRFMEDNDIDIVSFAEASWRNMAREDYANGAAWTLANRLRDIHEIVHVVSGYGTDVLGEMCELAFNIDEDPRPRATRFAIRANLSMFRRLGHGHADATIREAFQRGARTGLFVACDWEAMMDWPLLDVRKHLNVAPPPAYRPAPVRGEADVPGLTDLLRSVIGAVPAGL